MERRDYLLRMIEQFGQFAIALRKLILGGGAESGAVRQQLRQMSQSAGLDLEIVRLADVDTLRLFIAPGGEVDPARCWMYAETLYLDALDGELTDDVDRALDSYRKARALFSLIAPMGAFVVGFPEASERIEEIDRRVSGLSDPGGGGAAEGRRHRSRRIRRAAVS